jgi:hypothetical protein
MWWLLIGWWWKLLLWFFFTLPMLIIHMLRPQKYKSRTTVRSVAVCQNCGNRWEV